MRLINTDLLECDTEWSDYEDGFTAYSRTQIECAPSIDAVSVVRCKECIYYSDGECKCGLLPFSEYSDTANLWVTPKPDDFCSYGEREDE